MTKGFLILALLGGVLLSSASQAAEAGIKEEKKLKTEEDSKMNDEKLAGKWDKVKGSIQEKWGELTDDDLAKAKGKWTQLVGLIKEKCGDTKEAIEEKLHALLDKLDNKK